jgi:hypothetical protein
MHKITSCFYKYVKIWFKNAFSDNKKDGSLFWGETAVSFERAVIVNT